MVPERSCAWHGLALDPKRNYMDLIDFCQLRPWKPHISGLPGGFAGGDSDREMGFPAR
jgi:hypothetical protein